eukprot:5345955-Lingulodinium_polyedra.AAC.1
MPAPELLVRALHEELAALGDAGQRACCHGTRRTRQHRRRPPGSRGGGTPRRRPQTSPTRPAALRN